MTRWSWPPNDLLLWRLDASRHAATWDSGKGAELSGGRWNPVGYPVVYACVDAGTAILEVAVHKGFAALDSVPHTLTCGVVTDAAVVHVVHPEDVPNPNWLSSGPPSDGQQQFGRELLEAHLFIAIPSVVSRFSWNLIFNPVRASGHYKLQEQHRFALDTRLHPPRQPA